MSESKKSSLKSVALVLIQQQKTELTMNTPEIICINENTKKWKHKEMKTSKEKVGSPKVFKLEVKKFCLLKYNRFFHLLPKT